MYDEYTYKYILSRMLETVPDDYDKREGSIIYDALAPAAAELAQAYIEFGVILKLGFAGTSSGEFLELRTQEMGIARREATKSLRKGLFYGDNQTLMDVGIGSRFSIDRLNYTVTEKINTGEYKLECETVGSDGNRPAGTMLPIDYIEGMVSAELTDVLDEGDDEESDESLLNRYQTKIQLPSTSGNKNHYKNWALEVAGVGDAKVFPLWDGNGTVKVVIVDSDKTSADTGLIGEVAEYIEGKRPIGATVTVISAAEKSIDVSAAVTLASGYTVSGVTENFIRLLTEYFQGIAFESTYMSYAKVGTILLGTDGVLDYRDLLVGSGTVNISLEDEEIPVIGTITLGV